MSEKRPSVGVEQKDKKELDLDKIPKPLIALAWHNFLKGIDFLGWKLEESSDALYDEIERAKENKSDNFGNVKDLLNHHDYDHLSYAEKLDMNRKEVGIFLEKKWKVGLRCF